ncbi:MAG: peptidoglycan DD-metalloendopeptidase family protein [Deinococcales bacterium]
MSFRYKLFALLMGLGFAGLALAQNSGVSAKSLLLEQDIDNYQNILSERQNEIGQLTTALNNTDASLKASIAERDRLSAELQRVVDEYGVVEEEGLELAKQMAANQTELARLALDLSALESRLQMMLVNLYKQRVGRYARALVEAQSLFDLRVRNYYLSLLSEQDVNLLYDIDVAVKAVEALQATLASQSKKQKELSERLSQKRSELESTKSKLQAQVAALEASREGQLALRRNLLEEQQRIENSLLSAQNALVVEKDRLRREAEEAARKAALAKEAAERERYQQAAANAQRRFEAIAVPESADSGFISPFSNAVLVTPYGVDGTHINLRAPQVGQAVRSVMDGVVSTSRILSANSGYVVTVQHSSTMFSAYVNLQKPLVAVGDKVSQGDILGYLGGSALVPGDILQFRVGINRSDGSLVWVDPAERLGIR